MGAHLHHRGSASLGVQDCHPNFTRYTATFQERDYGVTFWTRRCSRLRSGRGRTQEGGHCTGGHEGKRDAGSRTDHTPVVFIRHAPQEQKGRVVYY